MGRLMLDGAKGYLIAGAAGIALVASGAAGIGMYGKAQYSEGYDDAQAEQRLVELEGFRATAGQLSGISLELESHLSGLRQIKPQIIKEYHHATTIQPLPAGCVLDADRLQHINAAISAARTSGQPGTALSGSGGAGD